MKDCKFNCTYYSLKNDYMFKAALQRCIPALKGLTAALLDMDVSDIKECVIRNPVMPGDKIDSKSNILDLKLLLNSDEYINIEMQVANRKYWAQRSLYYWGRTFSEQLNKGDEYGTLRKTCQIGILDFTLFNGEHEFYSDYRVINRMNGKELTDAFDMRFLELPSADYALEGQEELLLWARIFNAGSWDELRTLVEGRKELMELWDTMYQMSAEDQERWRLEAIEDRIRREKSDFSEAREAGLAEGLAEGRAEGLAEGIVKGREEGISLEQNRFNTLIKKLSEQGRINDIIRSASDRTYQEQLFKEFGL